MFIERSSARIRTVRTLSVLLGLVPCACLCGWAALRHSAGHRHAIERRCGQVLGLPVRIDRVEHLRPDALRLRGCVLSSPEGDDVLAVPVVDVESSATEIRVSLGRVDCTPQLTRVLAGLAQQWLRQPARFPLDCVVDVGPVSWSTAGQSTGGTPTSLPSPSLAPGGAGERREGVVADSSRLRVECVAGNGSRAVRISRGEAADPGGGGDEVRVIATTVAGAGQSNAHQGVRIDVTGTVVRPVPVAVLEACIGLPAGSLPFGADAIVSGRVDCSCDSGEWSGTADGRVERIDLAAAQLPYRLSGDAQLSLERIDWARGRITACDGQFTATRGVVEQRLLDALASAVGCRPGPAYRPLAGEQVRAYDEAAGRVRIGAAGLDLRAAPGRAAALALVRGVAIVEEPPAAVPLGRVAWLMSPPSSQPVPASKATGWLLGLFSDELLTGDAGSGGPGRFPSGQAERPVQRSEF